ncbi:MAG: Elongation factor Ts [candidate division WS2 bacterium ADurb.Bin280]|uniref:Elongation factor Ts n=1 Tax=candidate division WS2 bacterium ADurb.Bin280 TaxID=1852829 RepID=A0A1V5SES4_9BACT|nr:MAG: Elongation factor Ts [candidate division WS2 bacterium ADurb.Bin280]
MDMEKVRALREKTGAGVMDVKKALDDAKGDEKEAEKLLKERSVEIVAKKSERETSQGLIESYVHLGKIGVLVEINCETDFVARNDEFKAFAHEIALQIATSEASEVDQLLEEEYFKEPGKIMRSLLDEVIAKTGENIRIQRFTRYVLGESQEKK